MSISEEISNNFFLNLLEFKGYIIKQAFNRSLAVLHKGN